MRKIESVAFCASRHKLTVLSIMVATCGYGALERWLIGNEM